MDTNVIARNNVGRIAERIASNELEFLGFRVSDLNNDGTSANADLIAARHEKTWQIQVKGAANTKKDKRWWVQYGFCTAEIVSDRSKLIFNRRLSFYKADFVMLIAVRSPSDYCCAVMPVAAAEEAAQLNMDRNYRIQKRNGENRKPFKLWSYFDGSPKEHPSILLDKEREILNRYRDKWDILL